ncbi:aly/REF export factor 2 [Galendromus occidentalis]|uniref:Aly/REF export factor 2 n=1 Tax=Galendromus occidentalis TaxID=34638 RepID=A0AAJ6QW76_9ACAR|nr:aly/REF export factor 2 [Galendromus occidentalis]
MVDKVDMSLDDIIKSNRSSFKTGRGGRGGPRRGGGGARPRGARAVGPARKAFSTGAGRKFAPKGSPAKKNNGSSGDRWQHDKFRGPAANGTAPNRDGSSKLTISNLHYGVSDADIRELFNEFGALKKAAVHYDRSGRSLGTADVIFERRTDALRAMKQYNDVPLDGRPMKIEIVIDKPVAGGKVLAGRIGKKPAAPVRPQAQRPQRGGGRPGRQGAGRGGRGGAAGAGAKRAPAKKTPTKEQLDAELDAYVSKMDTN